MPFAPYFAGSFHDERSGMSHLREYQGDAQPANGRNLGDEWMDWDGRSDPPIREGRGLFLGLAAAFIISFDLASFIAAYLVVPRLAMWHASLPAAAWSIAAAATALATAWFAALAYTAALGRCPPLPSNSLKPILEMTFSGALRIARLVGVSRDRLGHSFIKVSNALTRATKPIYRSENLLILLPRCLNKEQLSQINAMKEMYPLTIHIVSGGELARKKVKEIRPTAVIGVACERDLVSGIRDVGTKFSVIGITNQRPDGPCRNTNIDMDALIEAVEFFVGPAGRAAS
jgi:hypothetical protein